MQESAHFTITVPMRDSDNYARPSVTRDVERELCHFAGGYTATIVEGGWIDAGGTLVHDSSTLFSVYVPLAKAARFERALLAIACDVRDGLAQDCVLITRQDSSNTYTQFV
jgi:hypothetical protein